MRKRIDKANRIENPLSASGAANAREICYLSKLDDQQIEQAYQLFVNNMGDMYKASSWGLQEDEKRAELAHRDAKFLWIANDDQAFSAFVHFRFCMNDDEHPSSVVLYVYEIQVAGTSRGQGLGRALMNCCETMAQHASMDKVMLTVFKTNPEALAFYEKLGYQVDETSPSQHNEPADYEILSKSIAKS